MNKKSNSNLNAPKLSVITITYNHEKYIQQTLDSIISQATNFEFELIIADDASTDNTAAIITTYQKKYPHIIRAILRKSNVGVQKNFKDAIIQAKGKYIAMCEGDDYWLDDSKLQQQIDFLDNNPDYALCFHPVRVFFEGSEDDEYVYPSKSDTFSLDIKGLLQRNYIQTNSVVYRKRDYANLAEDILPLDWYLHLYHAQFGKIGLIDKVMAAYRRHPGGLWWESQKDIAKIWQKYGVGHLKLYEAMLRLFPDNKPYQNIIYSHIHDMFDNIFDLKGADEVKQQVTTEFPGAAWRYMSDLRKNYVETKAQLELVNPQFEKIKDEYAKLSEHTKNIERQLELIQSSRLWKVRNNAARLLGKDKPQ